MRIFDENIQTKQSNLCLNGVKYSLTKANVPTGDVMVFTVDSPNSVRDQLCFTVDELKALVLMVTKEKK